MKKLLIAIAAVASAMVVNAAAYSWSGAVNVYDWNNDIAGVGTVQFAIGATTYDAIALDANGDAAFSNYGIDAGDTVTITTTLTNFSDGSGTSVYTTVFSQDFIDSFPSPDDALINILQAANTTFDAGGAGIEIGRAHV